MSGGIIFALVCAVIALVYGAFSSTWILAQPDGNERMREIAAAVKEGATAYLWRQYTTIAIAGVVLFLIIGFVPQLGWATAWGFFIGAVFSGMSGIIGMNVSVRANVRTAEAARTGLNEALNIAFRGGAVTGLLGGGVCLLGCGGGLRRTRNHDHCVGSTRTPADYAMVQSAAQITVGSRCQWRRIRGNPLSEFTNRQ